MNLPCETLLLNKSDIVITILQIYVFNSLELCAFRTAKCKGRLVTAHCWDNDDPRLLICRAQRPESFNSKSSVDLIEDKVSLVDGLLK